MPSTPLGWPAEGPAGLPEAPSAAVRAGTLLGAAPAPPPAGPPSGPQRARGAAPSGAGTLLFGGPAPEGLDGDATSVGVGPAVTRHCAACGERYPADFVVCPRDATPLADDDAGGDPLLGRLLGETYQIVRVVGEGGMGRVYEARHLRLKERRFAVKVLHPDLARNPEMAERFRREAESASSIHHPNVVDVFDVHQLPDGTPYFVGDFLDGEELAALVRRRGPLDPHLAVSVVRQVAQALAAAHARGIIHRDMKPENVIATRASISALEAGTSRSLAAKVLDFGISKALGAERTNLTRAGVIMGTPSYMAPEQARGQDVDHRADVYAVGAVLYFLLSGRRPFDSEDPATTLAQLLTEEPPRLRDLDPRIPEATELVVQRAMAKEARDRFATMQELEAALATLEVSSREPSGALRAPASQPAAAPGDVLGVLRVIVGAHSLAPSAPAPEALVRAARPTILVTSAVLGGWLVAGTTAALAGLVRLLHDGDLTVTECLLLVVGCLFAAATPGALYVGHVRHHVWPSSPRSVQLAADLKRTTTAVLVTYGGLSVLLRIGLTVLLRSSRSLASGFWDLALLAATLASAVAIGGLRPLLASFRRRRPRG